MANGYIPSKDAMFSEWAQRFLTYVADHEAELRVTPAEVAALGQLQGDWSTAYTAHSNAQVQARTCTTTKDESRKTFESGLRALAGRILGDRSVTDAMREAMGLHPRHATPTPSEAEIVDERPIVLIEIGSQLKHVIRMQTQTSSGVKKGKPRGVFAYELFRKVGTGPAPIAEMESLGMVKRPPTVLEYPAEDTGKTASYALRWVNTDGGYGAWSTVQTATIAA